MVRKQEKSDLTGLIKWNFQKVTFFFSHPLEQSCVVWHSSLTEENKEDLERVQKAAVRLIFGKHYENYGDALDKLNLQTLEERREALSLKFAENCLKNPKVANMFPVKKKNIQCCSEKVKNLKQSIQKQTD